MNFFYIFSSLSSFINHSDFESESSQGIPDAYCRELKRHDYSMETRSLIITPSVSQTTFESHREYGLLYTWDAANIGTATTETVNAFPLEKEIAKNPSPLPPLAERRIVSSCASTSNR
ncbi:MAG: hypothetical protein LBG15_01465 [Dysgonamonadaceae bacterium]|jgi:hypothetical protein|nr:hypothetical protein [Dysgonamonadaceae bacterium]